MNQTPPYSGAPFATIDLTALQHNVQQIRRWAPHSRMMAMVKAQAYGHGLLPIAKALAPAVECLGVARLEEAYQCRAAGITTPIAIFNSGSTAAEMAWIAEHHCELVLHSQEQLSALAGAKVTHPIRVWLKIDTGLHRLGITEQQAAFVYQKLLSCRQVQQPIGLLSHFSCADESASTRTQQQMARFDRLTQGWQGPHSLAASAAIVQWPQTHREWIRPGLILYGISPLPGVLAADLGLKPVMTLKSRLLAVREHLANAPVGYGAHWRSLRDTQLGVVALGYGDGYPRDAPSGTLLLVNGRLVPLVGRVSMDLLTVDLDPTACEQSGAEVIAWGPELPVETVAQSMGMSAYELVTRLPNRMIRHYAG